VFTRSTVVGAPVERNRPLVPRATARAVLVNSGIANVAMGEAGRRAARDSARHTARALGCHEQDVLVASTGVIGEPLPMPRIRAAVPGLARALSADGLPDAARAIMTTDTVPKMAATRTRIDGRWVHVAGIAKGAGMIEPDMATMLAFLLTDAAVAPRTLQRLLREAAGDTFNRLTVDGEGSTSDMALLLASGAAGNGPLRGTRSAGVKRLGRALAEVCEDLTRQLARDGEGATRLVTVRVEGARDGAEAERAARRIANSLLVKTAVFGGDPNWGRILQALGHGRIRLDPARTEVRLGGATVFRRGRSAGPAARQRAAEGMRAEEVEIEVRLGAGRGRARIFTCDLGYDYVRINAEYTT